jgi:hypothetical protein
MTTMFAPCSRLLFGVMGSSVLDPYNEKACGKSRSLAALGMTTIAPWITAKQSFSTNDQKEN